MLIPAGRRSCSAGMPVRTQLGAIDRHQEIGLGRDRARDVGGAGEEGIALGQPAGQHGDGALAAAAQRQDQTEHRSGGVPVGPLVGKDDDLARPFQQGAATLDLRIHAARPA